MAKQSSTPRQYDRAWVHVLSDARAVGEAAARDAAALIRQAVQNRGQARIIVGTGNSQLHTIDALVTREEVPWSRVEAFHMDEYVGLPADHPASFRLWLRTRLEERCSPAKMHYLDGDGSDLPAIIAAYARELRAGPIDVAFVGFGENGHIAFNDPGVADFSDPEMLKIVTIDEKCRRQQVGEGHFPTMADVPPQAITITCPGLFRADTWVCSVPDERKATAVRDALTGPVATTCPASLVRTHTNASVYLDEASASLLPE